MLQDHEIVELLNKLSKSSKDLAEKNRPNASNVANADLYKQAKLTACVESLGYLIKLVESGELRIE